MRLICLNFVHFIFNRLVCYFSLLHIQSPCMLFLLTSYPITLYVVFVLTSYPITLCVVFVYCTVDRKCCRGLDVQNRVSGTLSWLYNVIRGKCPSPYSNHNSHFTKLQARVAASSHSTPHAMHGLWRSHYVMAETICSHRSVPYSYSHQTIIEYPFASEVARGLFISFLLSVWCVHKMQQYLKKLTYD